MKGKLELFLLCSVLVLSVVSIYLNLKTRENVLSELSIGKLTEDENCKKICMLFHNSTKYIVDKLGNCWCLAEGSIISRNKIIKIKTWRNYGVIENVEETYIVVYTNTS